VLVLLKELGVRELVLLKELGVRLDRELGVLLDRELGVLLLKELGVLLLKELGVLLDKELGVRLDRELGVLLDRELGVDSVDSVLLEDHTNRILNSRLPVPSHTTTNGSPAATREMLSPTKVNTCRPPWALSESQTKLPMSLATWKLTPFTST